VDIYFQYLEAHLKVGQIQSQKLKVCLKHNMHDYVYLFLRGNHIARDIGTYYPAPFLMNVGLYQPTTGTRVHGIKFRSYLTSYVDPTQFLLYQYMDS